MNFILPKQKAAMTSIYFLKITILYIRPELSLLSETKSWAFYYIMEAQIDKDKFQDFLHSEMEELYEDEIDVSETKRALGKYTSNLHNEVKKKKIDPVIG